MVSDPAAFLPELSVIVPVLNEGPHLVSFLASLAKQRGVNFELILCDGGSVDGSFAVLSEKLRAFPFACRVVHSGPGRGRQLNAGAAAGRAPYLLFLHADSIFGDSYALFQGYSALKNAHELAGHTSIAGHFALVFHGHSAGNSWVYHHSAAKARLHRPYCVHGDQGFMLARSFLEALGGFDESLPFLEDVRLAKKVLSRGRWLLLPALLATSARRFESEGYARRQTLNALILACEDAGFGDWLSDLPEIYREQAACGRMRTGPFFRAIARKVRGLKRSERLKLWGRVGAFVCENAWQLGLMLDTARHYRRRLAPGQGKLTMLGVFDRYVAPGARLPLCRYPAALLAWLWFRWRLLTGRWR